MAYNGSIELISGIKQANNGTFPLVDASAVRITDSQRLSDIDFSGSGIYKFSFNIVGNSGTSPVTLGFGPIGWSGNPTFTDNARVIAYNAPQSRYYKDLEYTIQSHAVGGEVTILPGASSGTIEFLVAEIKTV